MNRYPQGWPVGYVEKIPAAGREHAIIRQRRVETALHSETTPATQLANTQEDVAIRGRFIEVWARGANGISPGTKKFFAKNVFHTKATPFMRAEPFLGKFLGEGP